MSGFPNAVQSVGVQAPLVVSGPANAPQISIPNNTYVQIGGPNKNPQATAGTLLFGTSVTGDALDRFTISAAGVMNWTSGAATDALCTWYRSTNSVLKTDGFIRTGGNSIGVGASAANNPTALFGDGVSAGATALLGMFLTIGTGAPANGSGSNGDIYFNAAGGSLTTIYQKRAGAWVGIV